MNSLFKVLDKILEPRSTQIIDLLDDTLLYISNSFGGVEFSELSDQLRKQVAEVNFTPMLNTILQELIQEKYIYAYNHSETHYGDYMATESTTLTTYYCISSKGERLCKAPILIYKNKPFHYSIFKEKLNTVWKVIKVIAAALVSLTTIVLAYLNYIKPHR